MYCFFINRANQSPIDIAKAPKNIPIAALFTPNFAAPPAATAAPATHNGQWAKAPSILAIKAKTKRGALQNSFFEFIKTPSKVS